MSPRYLVGAVIGAWAPALLCLASCGAGSAAQGKALPALWLIGDSTVRNGQDTGNNGQWGWGNPIAHYFDKTKITVNNKALGGTSSRTFQTPALWGKVLAAMKPGDFVIMQFGHNDGGNPADPSRARATLPGNGENTVEIDNPLTKKKELVHSYGWYLRQYFADATGKGAAEVVICSLIPRNRWNGDKIVRDKTHAIWATDAAKQSKALFVDLNKIVCDKYDVLGQNKVTDELFPVKETVHPDWAGAVLNAECVIDGLKGLEKCELVKYLLPTPPTGLKNPTGKPR
jgi:rhamnogalacturonan acetylesterase